MALPSCPFDPAKSLYNGLSVLLLKLQPNLTGVSAATDTVTKTAHGLTVGRALEFVSGTGWTGLSAGDLVYVVAVPTADTFKISTTFGGAAISPGTSTVGVFTPVHILEAEKLDDDPQQEVKPLARSDSKGVVRNLRLIRTKSNEQWMFDLLEIKRVLELSEGTLVFRKTGTATIWVPDVDDTTTCALKSEDDFAVSVSRDGKMTHGGDFSKTSIKIESLAGYDIPWESDAAA